MKEHGSQIIQLVALAIIIAAVVLLRATGTQMGDVAALGLGVAIGNLTSGLSPGPSRPNPPAPQPGQKTEESK